MASLAAGLRQAVTPSGLILVVNRRRHRAHAEVCSSIMPSERRKLPPFKSCQETESLGSLTQKPERLFQSPSERNCRTLIHFCGRVGTIVLQKCSLNVSGKALNA